MKAGIQRRLSKWCLNKTKTCALSSAMHIQKLPWCKHTSCPWPNFASWSATWQESTIKTYSCRKSSASRIRSSYARPMTPSTIPYRSYLNSSHSMCCVWQEKALRLRLRASCRPRTWFELYSRHIQKFSKRIKLSTLYCTICTSCHKWEANIKW